eukprot:jgi/Botrbrau1/2824/Bobra.0125s0033.1
MLTLRIVLAGIVAACLGQCVLGAGMVLPTIDSIANDDFAYNPNLGASNLTLASPGGLSQPRQLKQWPALNGMGISQTYFKLEPCAMRPPHVHMWATGLLYVIKGSRMVAAFVVEDASREVVNELSSGASAVFPQGLIHYQQNLGCETAEYVISYNAESPGTQVTFKSLAKTAMGTLLNATAATKYVQGAFVTNSDADCVARCSAALAPAQMVSAMSSSNDPAGR